MLAGRSCPSGGIPTKAFAFVLVLVALLLAPRPVAASLPDLVIQTVHFEVVGGDIIPDVAAFRASCDLNASGEPLALLDNETVRTTVAASPGACSMILILLGQDVAIPTITTTPLGQNSYYIPGLSLGTLGLGDVSLDLRTTLNSTTKMLESAVATVDRPNVPWDAWGAQRFVVQGEHGYGSKVTSSLATAFTYNVSLGLTIYVAGVPVYQAALKDFGSTEGAPSLVTPVGVDLLPHPLTLGPARDITYQGAGLNWTGIVDPDFDHMELWVTDGTANASYRITDRVASSMAMPLRAETTYRAGIISVDQGGQETASNVVTFRTLATPPPSDLTPTPPPTYTEAQANVIVVGTFAFIALLAGLVAYGFGRTRGRI